MRNVIIHLSGWAIFFLIWNQTLYFYMSNVLNRIYFSALDCSLIALAFYALYFGVMPRYFSHKNLNKLILSISLLTVLLVATFAGLMNLFLHHMLVPIRFDFRWNYTDLQVNRFFIVLIGVLGGCFARLAVDRLDTQRKLVTLEREKALAELTYLKAQLNPHFLFNALNGLHAQLSLSPQDAQHTLIALADLLRYQLYDCNTDQIRLSTEIAYLQNYFSLQRLRIDNCSAYFSSDPSPSGAFIAPLLLIPFIENAFKFISDWTDQENRIEVNIRTLADRLHFQCLNSFEPTVTLNHPAPRGIGLTNVKKRLDLLYPGQYELGVRTNGPTYQVDLWLPLRLC